MEGRSQRDFDGGGALMRLEGGRQGVIGGLGGGGEERWEGIGKPAVSLFF